MLTVFYSPIFAQIKGPELIDSLLLELAISKPDTKKVNILNQLSLKYYTINADSGIYYGEQGLKLGQQLNYNQGVADLNMSLSANYYMKSDYEKAISYAQKAAFYYIKTDDRTKLANAQKNIAVMLMQQSNYSKSLEFFLQALKYFEQTANEAQIAIIMQNMGILYYSQNEYDKALGYYEKAEKLYSKQKNILGLADIYCNIGNVFTAKKEYNKGIEYNTKALKIYEDEGQSSRIASCLVNIANVNSVQGELLKAIESTFKAFKINSAAGNKNGMALNLGNIGGMYMLIINDTTGKKYPDSLQNKKIVLDKAERYIQESVKLAEEIEALDLVIANYKMLSEAQYLAGKYENSLVNFRHSVALKDSVFSKENREKITELEQQRENDLNQKEIELQRLLLVKARNERWYFISGFAGLIILLLVVYNRFRVKKNSNEKLEAAYLDLKSTQQQLIQQEKLASLGALTAGIAHEIKNPLNFVNNFADLSAEQIDELIAAADSAEKNAIAADIKFNLVKIASHGRRADSIVQGMLMHSRHGENSFVLTDINKLCTEVTDLAFHGMKASIPDFNVEINKSFAPGLPEIKTISQDISRVLVNLLNNAFYAVNEKNNKLKISADTEIKYKPAVSISTSLHDETRIKISVKDNGSGIPEAIKLKIFEPFFTTKPSGEGTGLGLSICYDIIKAHGGKLMVDSQVNEYTAFIIYLPV